MQNVSGLTNERDFASHGGAIFIALTKASPKRLIDYRSLLAFSCGCGRVTWMFKGYPHRVYGCDIDKRHADWVRENLTEVEASLPSMAPPLPYSGDKFNGIISISAFSHLTEHDQDRFLKEILRASQLGAILTLSIHGGCTLERVQHERPVRDMFSMDDWRFEEVKYAFEAGCHGFVFQEGHSTTKG